MFITKNYRKFFARQLSDGELPQDLYDAVIADMNAAGKMNRAVYKRHLERLEERAMFDTYTTPYSKENIHKVDKDFKYRMKNPLWLLWRGFLNFIFVLAAVIGTHFVFATKRHGKKNLKGVKGAITVANHFCYLDCCLNKRNAFFRKFYMTVAPHNCKKSFSGLFMRGAGMLPLPETSLAGMRKFDEMLDYAFKKNAFVHFYGERALWLAYGKPRPLKEGVFYYSVKFNVPVIAVCHILVKPRLRSRICGLPYSVDQYVVEPLYPDMSLNRRDRIKDLQARVEAARAHVYNQHASEQYNYTANVQAETANDTASETVENASGKTESANTASEAANDTASETVTENASGKTENANAQAETANDTASEAITENASGKTENANVQAETANDTASETVENASGKKESANVQAETANDTASETVENASGKTENDIDKNR